MNRDMAIGLILGSIGGAVYGNMFAFSVVLWLVVGYLLGLFLTYFLLPLLYCQDCNDYHFFGVNNHETEHSLGKD